MLLQQAPACTVGEVIDLPWEVVVDINHQTEPYSAVEAEQPAARLAQTGWKRVFQRFILQYLPVNCLIQQGT